RNGSGPHDGDSSRRGPGADHVQASAAKRVFVDGDVQDLRRVLAAVDPDHDHDVTSFGTLAVAMRAECAGVIDLRSDTATRPTPGMREAIAAADVGDEQRRVDPTVTELQRRVAELLGQEAALFLPTATM